MLGDRMGMSRGAITLLLCGTVLVASALAGRSPVSDSAWKDIGDEPLEEYRRLAKRIGDVEASDCVDTVVLLWEAYGERFFPDPAPTSAPTGPTPSASTT